jgi:hypothetical protein
MKTQTMYGREFFIIGINSRRHHSFSDLHTWLREHSKGKWITMSTSVGFEKEEDAMFFKLAWKGRVNF